MNTFSIIDNLLEAGRVDKLVACVVSDISDMLDQPLDDDGYASVLDKAINVNPGVRILSVIDGHALVEFAARMIVELEWQSRQGNDNAAALHGLAVYLADWLTERIEEDEYDNGAFEDEDEEIEEK